MDSFALFQRILRYVFYLLVIATGVLYALSYYQGWDDKYWIYCGCGAVIASVIRFFIRFI